MKIAFTGNGRAGSWKIRGEQLGAAMGADVLPNISDRDAKRADLIVLVKRCSIASLQAIKSSGRKFVLDVVDFYPQPVCSQWSADQAISWVRNEITKLNPHAVIWPNQKMKADCDDGRPSTVIYHHHRSSIQAQPVRPFIKRIAYEGSVRYLGNWDRVIAQECVRRGWMLDINPVDIARCDAVIALRCAEFGGYAQMNWKSNVKQANAHAAGLPFIAQMESGYTETACGAEIWVDDISHIAQGFDHLAASNRSTIQSRFFASKYSLTQASCDMQRFLYGM